MAQTLSMDKSYKHHSMQPLVHRDCHQLPKPHMGAPYFSFSPPTMRSRRRAGVAGTRVSLGRGRALQMPTPWAKPIVQLNIEK
jgi:hypothetical protein